MKVADTHGIVYTPQEIVDFMCAAVEEVLLNEFGKKLGDDGVYVIDPCTGTGSFIVNLLRRAHTSNPRHFERFYKEQLFANEVMLMPYYIASLNIEHEYHDLTGHYESFEGVCFVDTLDLAEGAQMRFSFMTEKNTARVERQKQAPITVIIGNPPYNVGQLNENDNNKNRKYEIVDRHVSETYARDSKASNKNALSDPYVKFFRWATDRLQGRDGVVCYVSNNSFVDQIAFDGMRKHLMADFTSLYHIDLHGNVRQNPKLSGTTHNVFGIQVGVGITVAVRKALTPETGTLTPQPPLPHGEGEAEGFESEEDAGNGAGRGEQDREMKAAIYYQRVPELWVKEEKLAWLLENVDLEGRHNSLNTVKWQTLQPDARHTWLVPENADEFENYPPLSSREAKSLSRNSETQTLFRNYSIGLNTARDSWVYDFKSPSLINKMATLIETYNSEVDKWKRSGKPKDVDNFVISDETKIKWSSRLKEALQRGIYARLDKEKVYFSMYRPFTKKYVFFDSVMIHRQGMFPVFFPNNQINNPTICVSGPGHDEFRVLISDSIAEYKYSNSSNGGTQCFPFYVYDVDGGNRRENITDWALAQFRARYGDESITKWDIFYYVYGLLHHPGYRERYADNLKRELPRIPFAPDFRAFSEAGRALADLHLHYESLEPYELDWETRGQISYRVEKMRLREPYALTPRPPLPDGEGENDREGENPAAHKAYRTLVYNDTLTLKGIPAEVFDYRLGNRSALEWVVDQYQVKKDARSGIVSDPNGYSDDERYIVHLVEKVVRVSLETVRIVDGLAKLPFRAAD